MNKRLLRLAASLIIITLTIGLFVRYLVQHPEYWRQLADVSPWTIIWVLLLNVVMLGVLVMLTDASLRLCGKRLHWFEMFLLTSYSSIANFFGPLQSGPGVRAVYLKSKHQVRLRDYTLASLIVLGMFAVWSALFLVVAVRPWWQTVLMLLAVGTVSWLAIRRFISRDKQPGDSQFRLSRQVISTIALLTLAQVLITVAWYYVELKAVDSGIHISQAASYAGAANFSLFVSITPDGVGIREAFLVFSQHFHHVATHDIVAANIIDRACYVVFLAVLFIVVLSLHAKDRLQLSSARRSEVADGGRQPHW